MRKIFIFIITMFLSIKFCSAAHAELNIVATQTIFADLAREIGGEKINVKAIASPKFNVHFYSPKPSDVRAVKEADLYVNAGLDLEAWSDPLLEAAGKPQLMRGQSGNVDLSMGIRLIDPPRQPVSRSHGDVHLFGNPHFHMDPRNFRVMAGTLLARLKAKDPGNAAYYEENARKFLERLDRKIGEWQRLCGHCSGQEIVSYHKDIAYFANFLGIKDEQYLEPKPGIPPTAKHLQFLADHVAARHVKAIVLPTYYSRKQADKLAKRVGAKVITVCQNAGEMPGTDSFFDFFDYNIRQISEGLK